MYFFLDPSCLKKERKVKKKKEKKKRITNKLRRLGCVNQSILEISNNANLTPDFLFSMWITGLVRQRQGTLTFYYNNKHGDNWMGMAKLSGGCILNALTKKKKKKR